MGTPGQDEYWALSDELDSLIAEHHRLSMHLADLAMKIKKVNESLRISAKTSRIMEE